MSLSEIQGVFSASLADLSQRYHVRSLGLFGSRVRGDAGPASDLDVLVEFDVAPSLFGFVRLEDELTRLAGVQVDLVVKESLRPELAARILDEIVPCHG